MSRSGFSSLVYGLYLGVLGLVMILVHGPALELVGFTEYDPYWPRATGLLSLVVGSYGVMAGLSSLSPVILWSVYFRVAAFLFFTTFVVLGIAPPVIFLLGALDLASAAWSYYELRREAQKSPAFGAGGLAEG